MSTTKVFWDTSQLTKTELEVLEVAKKRTGTSSIQKKDGNYTTRHQKVIDNWQQEQKLTEELELHPDVVCYDFSDMPFGGEVYNPTHELIQKVFVLFQSCSIFEDNILLNPLSPSLEFLLQQNVLREDVEGIFKLSSSALSIMDSLIEEIRNDNLGRADRKGIMQYHPMCDFFLWLLYEMRIIWSEHSYFNNHDFYLVDEGVMRGTRIVELEAENKELVARDATEEELKKESGTEEPIPSPTEEEVEITIEEEETATVEQQQEKEDWGTTIKQVTPKAIKLLESITAGEDFPEGLLPTQLDTVENRVLLTKWFNNNMEEEVEVPKVYEFKRYLGGSRPPVNKRLIVVADIGEYKSLALFETYFANDEFFIEPSHVFLDTKKVKVLYWLAIDWGQEELVPTRFSPIYDNYVEINQDEMSRESYAVNKKGEKRRLSFCFYAGLSQEQMNQALQFYKDATHQ